MQSKRFYGWGYGDSFLIQKWKKYSYISFPNALECTVFIVIQAAVTFPYQNKDSIMQSLLLIDGVWSTQIFLDVANAVMSDAAPSVKGTARVAAAFVGSVFYKWLGTELGHLVGPICRGHFSILYRFDWFCGQSPGKVTEERVKEGITFAAFIFMAVFVTMFECLGPLTVSLSFLLCFFSVMCSIIYAYTHKI